MPDKEGFQEMNFPVAGIDLSRAFLDQRPRPVDQPAGAGDPYAQLANGVFGRGTPQGPQFAPGVWGRSTPSGLNVMGYEASQDRRRGGTRGGLRKYNPMLLPAEPVVGDGVGWIVQELNLVVGTGYPPPGGTMQLSQSGRVVTLVAVSQGNVYVAQPDDLVWTPAINQTQGPALPPLNFTGIVYSSAVNQKLWFADGTNWVYYDPSVNTVFTWAASAGALPVDTAGNTPRLICTWRGRIVLSGLLFDPQNWFMSAATDPTNFDYAPFAITPTQAIAGNNAPLGVVGDVITTLIPYTDDVLIFGGDHTIYMLNGDPMSGGQIDLVSNSIGMAWGLPWTMDPYGNIYFVSNKCGIYTFVPGQQPQRISQQVEQLLQDLDTGNTTIRMFWNDRFQGLHVFLSATDQPGDLGANHLFYELRTGAWWQWQFGDGNLDPLCGVLFDGNTPGDRAVLIGSWDGYVRAVDPTATDDDGIEIDSSVLIGPLSTQNMDDMLLKDLQGILGETSGDVTYSILVGTTAEEALASTPVDSGTWTAGRNASSLTRWAGHAVYVELSSTNPWAMEQIRARVATEGKVRRRGA
jgi:hypothetical protein